MVVEFGGGGVHWSWRFGRGGKGFLLGRVTKKGIFNVLYPPAGLRVGILPEVLIVSNLPLCDFC